MKIEDLANLIIALNVFASITMAANAVLCSIIGKSFWPSICGWSVGAIVFATVSLSLWWSNRPKKSTTR